VICALECLPRAILGRFNSLQGCMCHLCTSSPASIASQARVLGHGEMVLTVMSQPTCFLVITFMMNCGQALLYFMGELISSIRGISTAWISRPFKNFDVLRS